MGKRVFVAQTAEEPIDKRGEVLRSVRILRTAFHKTTGETSVEVSPGLRIPQLFATSVLHVCYS